MPDVTVGGVRFNTVRLSRSDVTDEPAPPGDPAPPLPPMLQMVVPSS